MERRQKTCKTIHKIIYPYIILCWYSFSHWARWYKSCHNIPQIIGGFIVGLVRCNILQYLFQ